MSLNPSEQQQLLDQLARCYAIEQSQLRCLTDNPEDGVYGFTQHGQVFVLKYTLPTARTDSSLQAQVDWINYLARHDVPVSRPIPSPQGRLVEQLPSNNTSTPEGTREYIGHCRRLALEQPRTCYFLGVVLKATNQVIGGVRLGVMNRDRGEGSFSYLFSRSVWGQGYATEALGAMVRFGFERLALNRLADGCDVENIVSARVMEKCGFRCVSEQDGERIYALTLAEWKKITT